MIVEQDIFKPSFDRNPVSVALFFEKQSIARGMRGFAHLCAVHDDSPLSQVANNEYIQSAMVNAIMGQVRPALFSPPNMNRMTFVDITGNPYATMIVSPQHAQHMMGLFDNMDFPELFLTRSFPEDGASGLYSWLLCTAEEDPQTGEWFEVEDIILLQKFDAFSFYGFDVRLTVPTPAMLEACLRKIHVNATIDKERLLSAEEIDWIVDAYTWFRDGYANDSAYLQIGGIMDADIWMEDEGLDASCLIACAKTDCGGGGLQYLYIKDGKYNLFTEMG